MFKLPDPKIPVFPGINDSPIAPTAQSAGNGAHLIAQHNLLVELFNFIPNSLPPADSNSNLDKVLTRDTVWYVDPANGKDSNNGLSRGEAFITLQKASAVAASYLNPYNYRRQIQLSSGFYSGAYLTGYTNNFFNEYISIIGDFQSPDNVEITDTLYHCGGGTYLIQGVTFNSASSNSYCLMVDNSRLNLQKVYFAGEAFTIWN